MKTNYLEKIKITWKLYEKFNSTRKVGEILGLARRTVQQQLKDYREYIGEKITLEVLELKTETPEIKTSPFDGLTQKELSIDNATFIVFGDSHVLPGVPYNPTMKALLKLSKEINPDYIINMGDTFDFASISSHEKLGWDKQFSVADEIEAGVNFLKEFSQLSSKLYMINSNHDCRYNKYLAKVAPQFRGVKGFDFRDHIPSDWNLVDSLLINKDILFLHGWHSGVHSAYNNAFKSGINVISGHSHNLEVKPVTDMRGTRFAVQTGTLSTIKDNPFFRYTQSHPLTWIAGFVVLNIINGKLQYPEVCYINEDNKAFFRGKIY